MRKCSKCGSEKTHIKSTGKEEWYFKNGNKNKTICHKCYCKTYNLKNIEKQKIYYKSNKTKISDWKKKYYRKNKKKLRTKRKQYYQNNKKITRQGVFRTYNKQSSAIGLDGSTFKRYLGYFSKIIRTRDNNTCQVCGNRANLSHHLIYRSTEPRLSFVINNGIALCKKCHNETHGYF